jgi:hypothetical protein
MTIIEKWHSNPINEREYMWFFRTRNLLKKYGGIDLGATKAICSWFFYLEYEGQRNLLHLTFRELKEMSYDTLINMMFEAAGSPIRMSVRNGSRP